MIVVSLGSYLTQTDRDHGRGAGFARTADRVL